jgi:type I restriction enzyme S subunit
MNADTLLENFEILVEAPSGIDLLKGLCLDLALRGKFHTCDLPSEDLSKTHSSSGIDLGIPNHWGTVSFSEHFDMKGGGQPPKSTFVDSPQPGYIRLYQIRDYGPNPVPVYIPSEIAPRTTKKGDILLARYGASGKVFWAEEGAYNVALAKLMFPESLYLKPFAFLLFKSNCFQETIRNTTRVAVDGFNKNDLKNIHFPLPPLDEQQLIITKVDELMALCDELEQQRKHRDNLRTATRKSAIDAISTANTPAELEAAWKRINNNWDVLADTPESVDALRKLVLDIFTMPKTFQSESIHKLGDVVSVLNGDRSANYPSKEHRVEFGIPFINAGHLRNGEVEMSEMDYITQNKFLSLKGGKIQDGDLLFCLRGSLGKCAIVNGIKEGTVASSLAILRPNRQVNSKYLLRFLQSGSCARQIKQFDNGSAQPNLAAKSILNFELYLPALSDQELIVAKVDDLMALCDQLESELKSRSEVAAKFARSVVSVAV